MKLGYIELLNLKTLLLKAIEEEKEYEAEYGIDWGSKKKSFETTLNELEKDLKGVS